MRELTQRVLAEQGYTVLTASNGQVALELATRYPGPIQLLLTDVIMPGLGDKALAEQLQQIRPDMKVLLLQKPFTPTHLARKVTEVLDRSP